MTQGNVYYTYILRCADDSFYVGHTDHLGHRLILHQSGNASAYTAQRRPVKLVYAEAHPTKSAAMAREKQIKKWTRAKKQALIDGEKDTLHDLAKRRH